MIQHRKAHIRVLSALVLIAILAGATASAATNYLTKYAEKVSDDAYEAARQAEPVTKLSGENLSLYRLGFAAGYDYALTPESSRAAPEEKKTTYILNTSTKKFHLPSCKSVKQMKEKNKQTFTGTRQQVINKGYAPCGNCHP